MTSLMAARAADRPAIFSAAYRDRQFRPAEPHPVRLVAAGDVHDDMARFTMAAHRAGSPDRTPSSLAPHWLSLQMVATRQRHDTRYPPFCIKRSPFARAEVGAPNWAFWSSASGAMLADSAAGKLPAMVVAPALADRLLDSDPALRWQVERDLAGAPPD
jgi:hypothetical protein